MINYHHIASTAKDSGMISICKLAHPELAITTVEKEKEKVKAFTT